MADFLNRLAARALGATPLAEPVIPTRFSPAAETNAFFAFEPIPPSARPFSEAFSETSADRPHRPHIHEAASISEIASERSAPPFQDLDEAPHPPLSQRPFQSQSVLPPFAEREPVQPSMERAKVRKRHLAPAIDPMPSSNEKLTPHRPQAITAASVPFAEPQPAPRITPVVEPKYRSASQHPETPLPLRPLPPTVRISIGRIEVRAEVTSPAPTLPAQRPRPSTLSLDQFLKQAESTR